MKLWLKALLSLAMMALLLWQIELAPLFAAFTATKLELSLLAFALFLFQQVVVAYAWHILLAGQNRNLPFRKTLEVHCLGSFFGTFLPSSVGMDVIRAYRLGRYLERGVDSASAMFVTRVVGFLVNFLLALLVAIPVSRTLDNPSLFGFVLLLTAMFIACVWMVLNEKLLGLMKHVLGRFKLARIADKITGFRAGIVSIGRNRRAMFNLVALSFFYQSLGIVIIYVLGRALGIELAIWHYFIYIPLITTITVLPISLAGIGIREGAFVFFFAQAGVAQAQALSLSLLLFAQTLALALLGGVWYLLAREQGANAISNAAPLEQIEQSAQEIPPLRGARGVLFDSSTEHET